MSFSPNLSSLSLVRPTGMPAQTRARRAAMERLWAQATVLGNNDLLVRILTALNQGSLDDACKLAARWCATQREGCNDETCRGRRERVTISRAGACEWLGRGNMLLPDFSRLSLTTPTAAPGAAPGAAADAVMSSHALIASILYNIRDPDASSVCEAVANWCSVSNAHHQACDENFNPALWKELAERVFPNLRQEVFPPLDSTDLVSFLARFHGTLTQDDLPWSSSPNKMTWKAWLFFLCKDYLCKRERFRLDAAAKKRARDKSKLDARAQQQLFAEFEAKLEPAHSGGGPPNQRILHRNARKLQPHLDAVARRNRERKRSADGLQDSRQRLSYHKQTYGRTEDHKRHDPMQRIPAYTLPGSSAEPRAINGFDDEVRENADTEDQWSNDTEGEDGADNEWGERYSDVAMSEAEDDDDGVDGEAQ